MRRARLRPGGEYAGGIRRLHQDRSRQVGQGDQAKRRMIARDRVSALAPSAYSDAHHRHPRDGDPAQFEAAQFELRFFRDDDVGGRRDHRRGARRQAGRGLCLQFHRPLRLRRADARAFHPAHPARRPESLLDEAGANFEPEKILAVHDAAREIRRSQRALDRHRHHRGRGVGRGGQNRRQAAAPPARRALQRRQGRRQRLLLCRRRLVSPGQDDRRICRTRCAAISTPATPWSR